MWTTENGVRPFLDPGTTAGVTPAFGGSQRGGRARARIRCALSGQPGIIRIEPHTAAGAADRQPLRNRSERPIQRGFTLIELLMVIVIIMILASMLLPVLGRTKERARRLACLSNQRQVGLAALTYATDHRYKLPLDLPDPGAGFARDWGHYPRVMHCDYLFATMEPYGWDLDVLACPSNGPNDSSRYQAADYPDAYHVNILYLGGLGDSCLRGFNSSYAWYDGTPGDPTTYTVAPESLSGVELSEKILTGDMNTWADFSGRDRVYSNHAGGTVFDISLAQVPTVIEGSNRVYADGHGSWVRPDVMGKDNTPVQGVATQSHFSHWEDNRPYWW